MTGNVSETRAKIAKLRAVGYSNQEISERLDIHPSTVSYHVRKMKEEAEEIGADDALEKFLIGAAVGVGAVALGALLVKLLSGDK